MVAATSGPVGAIDGQLAKIFGARAVGIAGGPQKVAHLSGIGFVEAIDHRARDLADQLAAATPDGIDVYFENVGGRVWAAVFPRLNALRPRPGVRAHRALQRHPDCRADRTGPLRSCRRSCASGSTLRGFIQTEFVAELMGEFLERASGWVRDGSLRYKEDIVDGLENAPDAFIGMLDGKNFGKLLIRVS